MKPEEIQKIVENALRDPSSFPWSAWLVLVIIFFLAAFLGSYFAKKAGNLATKEDIGEITRIQEEIKQLNQLELDDLKRHHERMLERSSQEYQLRLAAIDKRLEAHQEAYNHWLILCGNAYGNGYAASLISAREWFNSNCIYLTPDAAEAFLAATHAAFERLDIAELVKVSGGEMSREEKQEQILESRALLKKIQAAGDQILKAAQIPSIGHLVSKVREEPESEPVVM